MDLLVASLAERPDLAPLLTTLPSATWPTFMYHDPLAGLHYGLELQTVPEHVLVAVDLDHPERAVAKAHSTPFHWEGDLPDRGWDAVVLAATEDRAHGREPTMVSALEISIRPDCRGTGLSSIMLAAMRDAAAKAGFDQLVAPVRPNGKPAEPLTPMSEYAWRTRDDGLPFDPWLRVHVRAGGEIVAVCPASMTIAASLPRWREWTGLPFDESGRVVVPGGLTAVHVDVEADHAVYVEPNVWVRHHIA